MTLSEVKNHLNTAVAVNFQLPDGSLVPASYHVTEVGVIEKNFIDCGGTIRKERLINFQLWEGQDVDHRLKPEKLSKIITLSEKALNIEDLEVEVEYQSDTIGKYGLDFDGQNFLLTSKKTACLASDVCGNNAGKEKLQLSELKTESKSCCTPGGGCC
jgi:hypothetical protein